MKGAWLRMNKGLGKRDEAFSFIEKAWSSNQRFRIAPAPFLLYHDRSSRFPIL